MRSLWSGAISFGLVNIPVKLYPATERKNVKFSLLHSVCKTPIRYAKFCPTCEREVENHELVRGYEYEKGKYVVLEEEDFESIPSPAARTIEILDFINLAEIDPILFDKSYYLEPSDGGTKAYALLRKAMSETGRIAVARVSLRSKPVLASVRVYGDALCMATMFYSDEVRKTELLPGIPGEVELHPNEIKMATSLIDNLSEPFDPEKYTDEYRKKLLNRVEAKLAGEPEAVATAAPTEKVVDLMAALEASLAATRKESKSAKPASPNGKRARGTRRARVKA